MARANATAPVANPAMAALLEDLQRHPVNVARAHSLPKKRRGLKDGRPVTPVGDYFLPSTGIAPIDEAGRKVQSLGQFGLNAMWDIPKSAFKGSLYGGICGALTSLLFYRVEFLKLFQRKFPVQMAIFTGAAVSFGALLGGGIAGFQAVRRNMREGLRLLGLSR